MAVFHEPEDIIRKHLASKSKVEFLPSGRLGAEEDATAKDEGRNKRRSELQTPGNSASVFDDDIGTESQEDTCRER